MILQFYLILHFYYLFGCDLFYLILQFYYLFFYYLFKRSEVDPRMLSKKTPYEFLRQKMNKGIPGMDKTEVGNPLSMSDPLRRKVNKGFSDSSELGKPLPAPKMPVAPVPLIVRV